MKKLILGWLLWVLFLSATNAQRGTQRTGYEGDNFSLEGAIELFKCSNSIRDFERRLNTEDTWVNNLDLNYDGRIDYIRVEHLRERDFHAIVLQVPIDRYDVQDIAVIEIEKIGRRKAILQIIGDEDLYGEEVIVEPFEGRGYSNGRGGPTANFDFRRGYVNVFYWTPVQHIFGYGYQAYVSPYRWRYYPRWWSPWRPCGWNVFRPRVAVYHTHYHVVHVHRVVRVHNFYRPNRAYCQRVVQRTNKVRVKHGKKPIHRAKIKRDRKYDSPRRGNDKLDKRRRDSANGTTVDRNRSRNRTEVRKPRSRNEAKPNRNREDVRRNKPRSRNEVKQQKPRNRTQTQRDDVRGKVKQRSSSRNNRSKSKINKRENKTSGKSRTSRTKVSRKSSQSKKPSTVRKRTKPSSRKKVSRKN